MSRPGERRLQTRRENRERADVAHRSEGHSQFGNVCLLFRECRRRRLFLQVLEALDHIHSRGITHGNLDPYHLLWFVAECSWKLVDLKHASRDGRAAAQHEPGRYASPEFSHAKRRSRTPIKLAPSTDMQTGDIPRCYNKIGTSYIPFSS